MKGLKLYEDIFADTELCKLTDLVNDLHAAGINGELSGKGTLVSSWVVSYFGLIYCSITSFCVMEIIVVIHLFLKKLASEV